MIKEMDSTISAGVALSLVSERAIIAGTSWGLRTSLSATVMGILVLSLEVSSSVKVKLIEKINVHRPVIQASPAILGGI